MSNSVIFRRLVDEYGSAEANQGVSRAQPARKQLAGPASTSNKADDVLMQLEERQTGAVTWGVYKNYLRNAGGLFWAPIIVALLLLQEAGNGELQPLTTIHHLIFRSVDKFVPRLLDREYAATLEARGIYGGLWRDRLVSPFYNSSGRLKLLYRCRTGSGNLYPYIHLHVSPFLIYLACMTLTISQRRRAKGRFKNV